MAGVRVVSLNVSWEANNFTDRPNPFRVNLLSSSQWDAARAAWLYNPPTKTIGPAYVQSLASVAEVRPHVVLLQELQMYTLDGVRSIDAVLANLDRMVAGARFQVASASVDGGTSYTAFGCVVIVDTRRFKVIEDVGAELRAPFMARDDLYRCFRSGRPLAAAVCRDLEHPGHETLIVSSHSAHHVPWDPSFVRRAIGVLWSTLTAVRPLDAPRLIWGGDFNARVSIGTGGAPFGTRTVYKLPNSRQNVSTGKWATDAVVDWILATSETGRNPTAIGTDIKNGRYTNACVGSASDHRPVAVKTTAGFADFVTPRRPRPP